MKTWRDVGGLSGHYSRYPHTPTLVPGNAQHLPADAVHFDSATGQGFAQVEHALNAGGTHLVLADHALSAGAVHDQVQHATGLIAGDSHIFDGHLEGHDTFGHLPYVTLALSGFREFNLLLGGKTDFLAAAKNAGLDAAGTGVGGAVGVKLGAIIGTLILPGFGTAAGGIVGGFFGARQGRHLTSDIKQKAYREAAALYETHLLEFEQTAQGLESEAAAEFQAAKSSEQSRLMRRAAQTSQNIVQTKDALDSWIAYDGLIQPDAALPLLNAGSAEIASLRSSIQAKYRDTPWWKRFVWPDAEVLAHQAALCFLKDVAAQFRALRMKIENGIPIDRSHVMSLLGRTGILQHQLEAELAQIYAARRAREQQAHGYIEAVCTELLAERRKTEGLLLETVNSLKERIRNALEPLVAKLTNSSEHLKFEAGKLGINLSDF